MAGFFCFWAVACPQATPRTKKPPNGRLFRAYQPQRLEAVLVKSR
ncbi:hypothetical protein BVG79_01788 [Ketogulonicigenium robustum]|uniref:Uncharacterized protein n=1 Tax=Ketogulonicigenium robustum TaxID=92947 RepID=A0A1W6P0U6_9RHOB|nr:hypothetical protein BVG79_01788 [Ketogulonicigenium robustum]